MNRDLYERTADAGAREEDFGSRVRIDDVPFDRLTMDEAVARIVAMAKLRDRPRHVCTANLDHLVLMSRDADFAAAYADSDLIIADGAPIVWLSKAFADGGAAPLPERVAGSDLFWEVARASSETGIRIFLLGGMPGAASEAAERLRQRHPGAQICGTYCPPFETFGTREEQERIARILHDAAPDVLMVALGAPKQEKWIHANKVRLGVPVSIGVGGSFEMAAGHVKRAPLWVQGVGLEWFFRFAQQPSRLFKRYFVDDLPYLVRLVARETVKRARERRARVRGRDR